MTLFLLLTAYLLGSIPFAVVVCRLMDLPDPLTEGSHNPGATNVMRIGGKKAAAFTLLGDSLKGFIPVFVAYLMDMGPGVLATVGMAAFLGHLYPLFLGFKGGKGVATALGVLFGLGWQIGATVAAVWLFMALVVRISSLSALVAMALSPVVVWWFSQSQVLMWMSIIMTAMLFWRHRSNIRALLQGTEGRIATKKPS